MSTRIDIQVAQAQLSQRVKELAGLNREKRAEREQQVKEEAQIKAGADKAAAAAANDGTRKPIAAIAGGIAALDERARQLGLRSGVPDYYTPPRVAATGRPHPAWLLEPSDATFTPLARGIRQLLFTNSDERPSSQSPMQFVPGGGPFGTGVMLPSQDWYDPLAGESYFTSKLVASSCPDREPGSRGFTFEAIIRIGVPAYDSFEFGRAGASSLFNQCALKLEQTGFIPFSGPYFADGKLEMSFGLATVIGRGDESSVSGSELFLPGLRNYTAWHHVAIVQQPGATAETRQVSFYFDGSRIYTDNLPMLEWGTFTGDPSNVYAEYGVNDAPIESADPASIHGVRYTSRALYSGETFTPPVAITELA